jgi:nucleoside-diphosphate-sugar epimerase
MTTIPSGSTVLVTGLNGFIASHVADQLLERGYSVRGTVRDPEKGEMIKTALLKRHPSSRLSIETVKDFSKPGAYDTAVVGCAGIAHVATVLTYGHNPHEVVTPTVEGVKNILASAKKAGTVKRFVLTSSAVALYHAPLAEPREISSDTWETNFETVWDEPFGPENAHTCYTASKVLGEKAAWKFVAEENPGFTLTTVVPNYNGGEVINPKLFSSSGGLLRTFLHHPEDEQNLTYVKMFARPEYYVDVKDTARLHLAGLILEDVQNERLLSYGEKFNFNVWLEIAKSLDPGKNWPAEVPGLAMDEAIIKKEREIELLQRLGRDGFTSIQESLRSSFESE